MSRGWISRSPSSDAGTPRRGWRLWLVLLFFAGCGGQEAYGEANLLLCRAGANEACADDEAEHLVQPALFSRTWSQFDVSGVAVMADLAVDDADGEPRRALLWLDVDLGLLPPGKGGALARSSWTAEYSERTDDETAFVGRSVTGSVGVAEQLLLDGQPPVLRLNLDLTFDDQDGETVQIAGVVGTYQDVRDLDGQGERPQGYSASDDEYYCYDCHYGCGGIYVEDGYDSGDGGCGGDDTSDASYDSGGGCEGDSADSSYDSGGGGCEGDSADGDAGCDGDASAATLTRARRAPRLSLPRVLDLLFPIAIGVLLRLRRRRRF